MASVNLKSLETPLSKAKGHGSAKAGTHHWWAQRVSAIALIPLSIWFVTAIVMLKNKGFEDIVSWQASPVNATLMILFVIALFYHMWLGLQTVIEDYIHSAFRKTTLLIAIKLVTIFLSILSIISILKIALGN
jgi:succinate dehydrogenase membrane anchor subunit